MAAELIVFSGMFDSVYTLAAELRRIHPGSAVTIRLYTDSRDLFDVIKCSSSSEKRLMLDIACARESFKNYTILDIGHVRR